MAYLYTILLGLIQGLTEFLPISSSGHLVVIPALLRLPTPSLGVAMAMHFGTLLAVCFFFRNDLKKMALALLAIHRQRQTGEEKAYLKLAFCVLIAITPSALAGLLFAEKIDSLFSEPRVVAVLLIINAIMLFSVSLFSATREPIVSRVGVIQAMVAGLFQVASLLPGISRSGSTITGGIFSGLNKEEAARFSFLMSIPTILGASLLEIKDLFSNTGGEPLMPIVIGTAVSFVTGYFAIKSLLQILKKGKLYLFGIYCLLLGVFALVLFR